MLVDAESEEMVRSVNHDISSTGYSLYLLIV